MNRIIHTAKTQGIAHVDLPFVFLPNGTNPPTIGAGDATGSYITPARTGVGTYTLTTKDKYLDLVSFDAAVMLNAPVATTVVCFGAPVNAGGIWTLPFTTFVSGAAADIAANANNRLAFWLRFRNSTVTP